jgi:hypothetical protein
MKKTTGLWIILNLIFLAIFNAVFFGAGGGGGHNAAVWVSYGFIHFAYLALLLTTRLIRGGKSSAVFGFALYYVSVTYFYVEFAVGVGFILASPENYKAALLVQLCVAGLYAAALVSNMIANERTADSEEARQSRIEYVKFASAKLKTLLENIGDAEAKKTVERVYDAIYSSPVKSHPDLAQAESGILQSIDKLAGAVRAGNKESIISTANDLSFSISERNNILKTLQ